MTWAIENKGYTQRRACGSIANPIVQYMLKTGVPSGPFDGTVSIKFPHAYGPSQSMDFNEVVCEAAASALSKALGIAVYMESRPD